MAVLRSHCAAKRHVMRAAPVSILRWVRHRARLAWLEHMITTAVLRRDARLALPARFRARVQLYARVVVLARVMTTVTLPHRALGVSSGNIRTWPAVRVARAARLGGIKIRLRRQRASSASRADMPMWLAATTCLTVSAVLLVSTWRTRGKRLRATALRVGQADMRRLKATVSRVRVLHVLQGSGWALSATQTHLTAYHVKRAHTGRRVR